jgi:hypothetical protein
MRPLVQKLAVLAMLWGPTLPFPCGFVEIFPSIPPLISNVVIINPSQV